MRVIPQGGAPKKGGPEASASLASLKHTTEFRILLLALNI